MSLSFLYTTHLYPTHIGMLYIYVWTFIRIRTFHFGSSTLWRLQTCRFTTAILHFSDKGRSRRGRRIRGRRRRRRRKWRKKNKSRINHYVSRDFHASAPSKNILIRRFVVPWDYCRTPFDFVLLFLFLIAYTSNSKLFLGKYYPRHKISIKSKFWNKQEKNRTQKFENASEINFYLTNVRCCRSDALLTVYLGDIEHCCTIRINISRRRWRRRRWGWSKTRDEFEYTHAKCWRGPSFSKHAHRSGSSFYFRPLCSYMYVQSISYVIPSVVVVAAVRQSRWIVRPSVRSLLVFVLELLGVRFARQ